MRKKIFGIALLGVLFTGCNNATKNVNTPEEKVNKSSENKIETKVEPTWISDNNGCKVWNTYPQTNETVTWSGSCKDGYATGEGVLQSYVNGKPSGTYKGIMLNGKENEKGILTYANGSKYEGNFKDGKREGKGILTFADGTKYEGDFKDGKKDGKGILISAGRKYEGDWKDDRFDGKGTSIYTNGKYEGDFKNGKRNGKGIYNYSDGDKYEGEYKNDIFDGKGIYIDASGVKYEGEFKDGIRDGFGILILPANNQYIKGWGNTGSYVGEVYVIKGKWANGKFVNASEMPIALQNWMDENSRKDYEIAIKSNNVTKLVEFLNKYPLSSYKSKIVIQIDSMIEPEYQKILKNKDIGTLQAFANKYPVSSKSKDALNLIEQIKKDEANKLAAEATRKFNQLGKCIVGETVYNRESWDTSTSSGNILADALFNASIKESFVIEFEGIVKGFTGKKVEVYIQDYSIKQTQGGGFLRPVTGVKGKIADYADKKVGKSYFFDRDRCTN